MAAEDRVARPLLVDLLRHGATVSGNRYCGITDVELTSRGWTQMTEALPKTAPWQHIISSPLQRCARFAHHLGARLGVQVDVESGFRELDFGAWEGRSAAQLLAQEPAALQAFWDDPLSHTPPGGESLRHLHTRVMAAWHKLLPQHHGEHLLIVSHGGVIRVLLAHILNIPLRDLLRIDCPHASLNQIEVAHTPGKRPRYRLRSRTGGLQAPA